MKRKSLRFTILMLLFTGMLAATLSGRLIAEEPAPEASPPATREAEPLPPRTGYRMPETDFAHLDPSRVLGDVNLQDLPAVLDWRTQDGGRVTPVKNQGSCGSCYAFGSIAHIESTMLMDGIGTFDFSENNAKECNWREINNTGSGSCDGGSFQMLMPLFSTKGVVLESDDPYVAADVDCNSCVPYSKTLLDWHIVSGSSMPATEALKQYLYDYGPLTTSMYADSGQGFNGSYDGSYTLNYTSSPESTNHCVTLVGWSNNLPPVQGGSTPAEGWIVKNSWGSGWGDGGYFYVTYGAANVGLRTSFVGDWKDYDPGDYVMYYDEDGYNSSWGYGDTTAWGLAEFTPPADTQATNIEFWTNDAPATVDVYLYDTFNGSTLSNLLASVADVTYNEAGFHSVALPSPIALTASDDVYAAVFFTNASYNFPIAADGNGPSETGRTWISNSGTSWSDLGTLVNDDVAIRLRTSHPNGGSYSLRGEQCGWSGAACPLYDNAAQGDQFAGDAIHSLDHTVNAALGDNDEYKFYRNDGDKWLPSGSNLTFDATGSCDLYLLAQENPYGITVTDCDAYAAVTCDSAESDFSPVSFLGNEDFGVPTETFLDAGVSFDLRVEVYASGLTNAGVATTGDAVQVELEYRQWDTATQDWGAWTPYGSDFAFEQDEGNNWQYLLEDATFPQGIYELRATYTDWTGAAGNTGSNTTILFVSNASTTPHSIPIDADLSDWRANEQLSGRDGATNSATWDERYIYAAWNGGGGGDKCILGLDVDSGAANDTVGYAGAAFPATGQPDYILEYNKGTNTTFFFQRNGSAWTNVGTSGIEVNEDSSGAICEARIPRARLNGALDWDADLGVVLYQSNWDSSWVFGASPVEGNSSGGALQYLNAQFHWPNTGGDETPGTPTMGGRSEQAIQSITGGAGGAYIFGLTGAVLDFPSSDAAPDANCDVTLRVYENHFPPDAYSAVMRYYDISAPGRSGFSAALTLAYDDGELYANAEGALDLYRWTGSVWEAHAVAAGDRDPVNNTVTTRGVTEFSRWTLDDGVPTAVELIRFEGFPHDDGIRLEWETATEFDLLGFNLYRSAQGEAPRVKVNAALIPAQLPGNGAGNIYSWDDLTAAPNVIFDYWLEDVDASGAATLHGPVKAAVTGAPNAIFIQSFQAHPTSGWGWSLLTVTLVTGAWLLRRRE
ncbi:MAG: hypothetical protein JXB35_03245 [Anaerolineae bacterium]|nr:hypothetical protein [Anaerolineae bacterium]